MSQNVVSDEHRTKTCLFGQGEKCCSFLIFGHGFECAKGGPAEATINARRVEGTMRAKGNNCGGPPDFGPIQEVLRPEERN